MANIREFKESPWPQGKDEQIAYTVTTTPWGSTPAAVTIKLFSKNTVTGALTDVSATCLDGAASVNGDVITTPTVKSLSAWTEYRIEVMFTVSGNVMEAYGRILAEE